MYVETSPRQPNGETLERPAIVIRTFATLALLAITSCADRSGAFHPTQIDSALAAALARDTGTVVSLDSLGPAAWTAFYIIGPYTSEEAMRRCMSPSGSMETYGIVGRDDIVAYYFKRPDGRLSSATFQWRGHLAQVALGREYPRGNASFVVRYDTLSRQRRLYPAGASTRSCS